MATGTWDLGMALKITEINTCISETIRRPPLVKAYKLYLKKNKIWRKTIFNMADGILTSCNVACSSGIVTVNSPSAGSTSQQCDTWLWDDMPLNSPKRPPYIGILHLISISTTSPPSTCHSSPVSEILSKSDLPWQKKWRHVDFQDGGSQPSWIVGIQ